MGQYDSWDYLTHFIQKNPDTFTAELSKPPYSIKVTRHPDRPHLVMFKYHQFESDFSNPIVRCCRGSVYDICGDTVRPYLMPFFKFSNYGEPGADPIDWNHTVYVRDKLDGSLLKLLKEPSGADLWTTNGSFDTAVAIPEPYPAETEEQLPPPHTFASLRDYALKGHEDAVKNLPRGWTFLFELTSPYNKIIVPYRKTKLTLLGCRDDRGQEHTPEWAQEAFGLAFETPTVYPLASIDAVIRYCASIDANDREGVVVQDAYFNRVKIKAEHYLSLAHLKGDDHFSDERIFIAMKQGSIDDALGAWPEIRPRTEEILHEWRSFKKRVLMLCEKAAEYYETCRHTSEGNPKQAKKQYAQFVLQRYGVFSSFLFEAIKEAGAVESLFDRITYTELKSRWLPALEAVD